jgi:hypothetical protein|tara:strand:- start:1860 stop:2702 length:843 start_codon:yes stop_codon:yes gene_type:complete
LKDNQFIYSISWRSRNNRYGNNLSSKIGNDFEYSGSKNFNDHPDLTRIDIKNSITDPYEDIYVKTYNLNNPINLVALCDVSSSMFVTKKNDSMIRNLSKIIANSAVSQGDRFSMICYNDSIKKKFLLEPDNNLAHISQWIDKFTFEIEKSSSDGIKDIDKYLPEEKSLIFWISDFHHTPIQIEEILNKLSNHHVIPIFISSESEIKKLPNYGFRKFTDSEMNLEHEVFLRPSIKQKILTDYEKMKIKIFNIFSKKQLKQIEINEDINIESIQQYFIGNYI